MIAIFPSFLLIVLAEMGDKTQLLAMAFGTKYKPSLVLCGVFIATVLNHSLAVFAGRFLVRFVPMEVISFCAALSFIYFGIWTLKGDRLRDNDGKENSVLPIFTIAVAFFVAEMGDKTQLATVSLATQFNSVFGVLTGTTLGMVAADALGIMGGKAVREIIPPLVVKWMAALAFIFYGLHSLYQSIAPNFTQSQVHAVLTIVSILTFFAALHYRASDEK